jgi:hypothetical protein
MSFLLATKGKGCIAIHLAPKSVPGFIVSQGKFDSSSLNPSLEPILTNLAILLNNLLSLGLVQFQSLVTP